MAVKKCWAVFHNNPETVQSSGMGYSLVGKKGIDQLYIDESTALSVADEIASKNPGTQVVILEAKTIVEAKMPDTIAKEWKTNGELIPVEKSVKDKSKKIRFDPVDAIERQMHADLETERVHRQPRPARELRPAQVIGNPFQAIIDEHPAVPAPNRERGF